MGRQRRRFSSALKARVAIEAIKGHRSVSELAGEHQVHPSQITQWKKPLLDSAEQRFSDRRVTEKKDQEELLAKLYQQIGQMKVELDWLQKNYVGKADWSRISSSCRRDAAGLRRNRYRSARDSRRHSRPARNSRQFSLLPGANSGPLYSRWRVPKPATRRTEPRSTSDGEAALRPVQRRS